MTSKKPRINVTFAKEIVELLIFLAKRENKSVASVVRELAFEALEMREDLYLSQLAKKLDKKGAKTYTHKEAWK